MPDHQSQTPIIALVLIAFCFPLAASAVAARPPQHLAGLFGPPRTRCHETPPPASAPSNPASTPATPKACEPASFEDFGFAPSGKSGVNPDQSKLPRPSTITVSPAAPASRNGLASLAPRPEPLPTLRVLTAASGADTVPSKPAKPRDGNFTRGTPVTARTAAKPQGGETKPEPNAGATTGPKAEPKAEPKPLAPPASPTAPAKPAEAVRTESAA